MNGREFLDSTVRVSLLPETPMTLPPFQLGGDDGADISEKDGIPLSAQGRTALMQKVHTSLPCVRVCVLRWAMDTHPPHWALCTSLSL